MKQSNSKTPRKIASEKNIPVHFLDVLAEHVSDTLNAALEKINAPAEVKAMAESLYDIVTCLYQDGQPDEEFLQHAIARAAMSVEAAGGIWYAPSGESTPRVTIEQVNYFHSFLWAGQLGEIERLAAQRIPNEKNNHALFG